MIFMDFHQIPPGFFVILIKQAERMAGKAARGRNRGFHLATTMVDSLDTPHGSIFFWF